MQQRSSKGPIYRKSVTSAPARGMGVWQESKTTSRAEGGRKGCSLPNLASAPRAAESGGSPATPNPELKC